MSFAEGPSFGLRSDASSAFKKLLQALCEQHDRDLVEAAGQGRQTTLNGYPGFEAFLRDKKPVQWPTETTSEPEAASVPESVQLRASAAVSLVHAVPDCNANDVEAQKVGRGDAEDATNRDTTIDIASAPSRTSLDRSMSGSLQKTSRIHSQATARFSSKEKVISSSETVSALAKFVRSHRFDHISAFLLVSNALFIGVQVEYEFADETPAWVLAIDYLFCILFIVELFLRMWNFGCNHFWFRAEERGWNLFDSCIVGLTTLDVFLSILLQGQGTVLENISVLRIVRMIRITRVLRIIRVMKVFRDLRVLMVAIASTLKTGVYAFFLIATAIWVFAIAITQLVAAHVGEKKSEGESVPTGSDLLKYFGSLWKSVLTLYMTITGGIDWKDAVFPLFDINAMGVTFFLFYTLLMVLCVMNVLNGLFVHAAIESANQDTESVIQYQIQEKQRYVDLLRSLFNDLDENGNGRCTFNEFETHLSDSKMQALFGSLEIEVRDAMAIFELFDHDDSGEIDLDEFVTGCITLRGTAKAVQMEKLKNMNGNLQVQLKAIQESLRDWPPAREKIP